jgi:hypothetical protein
MTILCGFGGSVMHKVLRWTALAILVASIGPFALAQSQNQSLADAARAVRKSKPQAEHKTWTNENIGSVPAGLATEGAATTDADSAEAKKECDKTKDADCEKVAEGAAKAKPDEGASKSKADQYKKQLETLQQAAAELEKEANLNEREWKLSQAAFYGDAGTQLRDQKKYADDQSAHQKDADRLQKALQEARAKIDALKEQARKDGVNL